MADTAVANEVKIEEVGPALKRLTITVPAETITEKVDQSIGSLATETTLPGFRKGRAPRKLIERRFGQAVQEETRNQVVADAYSTAIQEHEIKPVGEPTPAEGMDDIKLEVGKPMTFAVEVEVLPEFELPEVEGLEIKKPILEISDKLVEEELDRQKMNLGEAKPVTGDFEPGDRLIGPATATKKGDDEPFFRHDRVAVVYPAGDQGGPLLGVMVDDLHKRIKGKAIGDVISVETKGPESHEREDVRGADITIELTIAEVYRIEPATTEQVIAEYEMGSEDVLREQIKLALEQRRDQEQAAAMREQIYDHLNDSIDFDLPEKLSNAQAERAIKRQEMEMLYRGVDEQEVERRLAEIRSEAVANSRKRLKLFFVLHKFAEKFEVSVSEQEVNGRIASIAAQRGERPEQLRAELIQSGRINEIGMLIREHKTADRLVDQATVTEITAEEWAKMVESKREGGKKTTKKKTTKKKTTKKS